MATSSPISTDPTSVESLTFEGGEPERVAWHLHYDDASAIAWGYVPGVALCGFIFTKESTAGISNASLVLAEDCSTCHDRHIVNMLEFALDGGLQ